jgi:hypothetical protein
LPWEIDVSSRSLPLDYDIVIYAGTSYQREFRWLPDGTNPIDFTGWTAMMLIGQPRNVADLELTTDPGNGITLTSLGQIVISMTPATTVVLQSSTTFYNLDLTQPDGFVRRFLRGRVSVIIDVKQPV